MQYDFDFMSRRSSVLSTRGAVATSHPLAAQAGASVLREGGNAADAAIAAAAMLCVVEPVSNGIGGDCFALYYDAKTRQVTALNGSGRSAYGADADSLRAVGYRDMPKFTGAAVTVPGVARGWSDLLERHGCMPLAALLAPAIDVAQGGFPVTEWIARAWAQSQKKLRRDADWNSGDKDNGAQQASGHELLIDGRAPKFGEVMRLPTMAGTLRGIAEGGADFIYTGEFARNAAAHVQRYGGWLTERDFADHRSEWPEPLSIDYRGVRLYECPPNGQGISALIACGLADMASLTEMRAPERVAYMVDCMRVAMAEAEQRVFDPGFDVSGLWPLDEAFFDQIRKKLSVSQAYTGYVFGPKGNDTVYLSVVDGAGNACSWIQSCYMGTGTGLVVPGTGVSLQNRGHGFSLDAQHRNHLAPHKRPFHTIIPAMTTRDGELHACFGVMGGHMQPQGHFQVLTHLLNGLTPQAALDAPRWQLVGRDARLMVEPGLPNDVVQGLMTSGYLLEKVEGFDRIHMGGGQIIVKHGDVLIAGSDPRKDGCAVGL
ncbi:MAG: gamma-glutamyltransferase family protein [Planctomycetes bacterium]|nr:gamma-glutamyltransferase family protein [Planctomycetota bacterium]